MPYFPFFADIKGADVLVVGGGRVALSKIQKLLRFEPKITVTAPEICAEIEALTVKIHRREFLDGDVDGRLFVIAATDDEAVNARIYSLCKEKNIPINTVDDAQKCSFVFPALCTSDDVTVGISTSGKSPLFAKFLRKRIESIFDEELERTERILAEKRPEIKRDFDTADKRKEVAQALLDLCIERGGAPDENEINTLLGSFKEQNENKNRNKEIGACAGTD